MDQALEASSFSRGVPFDVSSAKTLRHKIHILRSHFQKEIASCAEGVKRSAPKVPLTSTYPDISIGIDATDAGSVLLSALAMD